MKIDRLIGILVVLLQNEKVTAKYLAKKFEVSVRTINRDIQSLSNAGIPICTLRGVNGGISIMEGYKIRNTLITSSEMKAILAGLKSLDSVSGTNRYSQLMEKISAGCSDIIAGDQHILIDLSSWDKESISEKITLITSAIEAKRLLQFVYYSKKGKSERIVEPYSLVFKWKSWYLWGYCSIRKDWRLFKLGRMDVLKCGRTFEPRIQEYPNFSEEKVFPHKFLLKAVFHEKCKWRLIDEFGIQSIKEEKDGKLYFEFGFTDEEYALSWLLSFGADAEVIEPVSLRVKMYELSKKCGQIYKM